MPKKTHQQKTINSTPETSWEAVSRWYDDHLSGADTYHEKVVLPNILRVLDIKSGEEVLDLACGQGFFSEALIKSGAKVTGIDSSSSLIKLASSKMPDQHFIVASAEKFTDNLKTKFDKIVIILAIQNIKDIKKVFEECKKVLKTGGIISIVMNHPIFRIPQDSSWQWEGSGTTQKEYRRIDSYLSEKTIEIVMHPGEKNSARTSSFHRPLQYYIKHARSAGLVISRLEEWISHRSSELGPRQKEEDRMRKEIPLFMYLELKNIGA